MSKGTVTISGAPVKLRELVSEAEFFRTSKPLEISVDGLYHSPLLYDNADVLEIMGSASESTGKPWRPARVVLSIANGSILTAEAADVLMEQAVSEVLKQPLKWDSCLDGMLAHIVKCNVKEYLVFSLGTDQASRGVVAKLRIGSQYEVASQDLSNGFTTVAQASGKFSSSKIAIVGMSGRFPGEVGSEVGVEALWHVLETVLMLTESFLRMGLTSRLTTIPLVRSKIHHTTNTVASLRSLVCSMLDISVCLPVRPPKLIPCTDWHSSPPPKPWKCQVSSQTVLLPPTYLVWEHFTDEHPMTGVK